MSVLNDFKEFFDGSRERKREAVAMAQERLDRVQEAEVREGIQAFMKSGDYDRVRTQILTMAANLSPSPEAGLDSAGAYWYRKGLETAVQTLDTFCATAETE